jgi:hypothetical protein
MKIIIAEKLKSFPPIKNTIPRKHKSEDLVNVQAYRRAFRWRHCELHFITIVCCDTINSKIASLTGCCLYRSVFDANSRPREPVAPAD